MIDTADRAIAIVGLEAVMPGARDGAAFWQNIKNKVYSISEVHPDRWDPALYYDADIAAPDKCYTKLGGWVRDFEWEPMKWRLPIPRRADAGRLAEVERRRRAGGRHPWQRHRRREALLDQHAIQFPEFARELR